MISVMIEKVKTMIGFCSLLLDFLFRGYPSCNPSGIVFFETAIIYYRGDKTKRLKIKLPFKLKVTVFMVYSCRFPFAKVTVYFVLGWNLPFSVGILTFTKIKLLMNINGLVKKIGSRSIVYVGIYDLIYQHTILG